jgi:hypothetical protein
MRLAFLVYFPVLKGFIDIFEWFFNVLSSAALFADPCIFPLEAARKAEE